MNETLRVVSLTDRDSCIAYRALMMAATMLDALDQPESIVSAEHMRDIARRIKPEGDTQ